MCKKLLVEQLPYYYTKLYYTPILNILEVHRSLVDVLIYATMLTAINFASILLLNLIWVKRQVEFDIIAC